MLRSKRMIIAALILTAILMTSVSLAAPVEDSVAAGPGYLYRCEYPNKNYVLYRGGVHNFQMWWHKILFGPYSCLCVPG